MQNYVLKMLSTIKKQSLEEAVKDLSEQALSVKEILYHSNNSKEEVASQITASTLDAVKSAKDSANQARFVSNYVASEGENILENSKNEIFNNTSNITHNLQNISLEGRQQLASQSANITSNIKNIKENYTQEFQKIIPTAFSRINNLGESYFQKSINQLQNFIQIPAQTTNIIKEKVKVGEGLLKSGISNIFNSKGHFVKSYVNKSEKYVKDNLTNLVKNFEIKKSGNFIKNNQYQNITDKINANHFQALSEEYEYKNLKYENSFDGNVEHMASSHIQTNHITTNVIVETGANPETIASVTSSELLKVQTNLLNDRNKYK